MKLLRLLRHPLTSLDEWWLEVSPNRRLDHGPVYICVMLGLMGPSLSIVLVGPVPNTATAGMGNSLQIAMCAMILLHAVLGLHAAALGSRWYFKGTLLRAYRLGYSAAPAGVSGLFVYGGYILLNTQNFLSALGGMLTPMLGVGIAVQATIFWLETRRIERNIEHGIAKAVRDTDQ